MLMTAGTRRDMSITEGNTMFKNTETFSSFSVSDLKAAKQFYGEKLGLDVTESKEGLALKLNGGGLVFIYPKPNHSPASFTVLNFRVGNIEQAVDDLVKLGVTFEHYEGEIATDAKGIHRGPGPTIAWFKDPAGNILSIIERH